MPRSPSITTYSKVARPSGPLNDHVTSQIPGASCTALMRRFFDCFNFEDVFDQSEWFAFDRASADVLRSALSSCAQPLEASCDCPLHRSLRKTPLPVEPWTFGFQAGSHVQPIAIVLENGLPSIDRGANDPPSRRQGMESD